MSEIYQLQLADNQYYPYKIVKSRRAKYIRIKISALGELSVVLPRGAAEKHAHGFLQKKSQWVVKTIKNIPVENNTTFPEYLDLKLLNECWSIGYIRSNDVVGVQLQETSEYNLEIKGDFDDWEPVKSVINKWCKGKAKTIFREMLETLAEEHGFHFNRLSIRSQKTRWGSCSMAKNINLNCKLLFMPTKVAEYVMIHELCHTIEMNHSLKFWRLVEDCDTNYKNNRKQLKFLEKELIL